MFSTLDYGEYKGLTRRTASDKVLRDKAFNIAKNPKHDGYQRELASMALSFILALCFDKKTSGGAIKSMLNEQIAEELHKSNIRKFLKRKVYSPFKDNTWDADLADMQLISKFDKGISFLLCVIDIFSKHASVVPLKDKK